MAWSSPGPRASRIAPTLYEAIGIPQPTEVNGVQQKPIEGTSMVYTFDHPKAPDRHRIQYFEMFANRAIYEDGWVAATHPKRVPWVATVQGFDANSYKWELYNVAKDYSEADDLASKYPDKLKALQADFLAEARKYNVLPLDPSALARTQSYLRPYAFNGRQDFTFYPGPRLPDSGFPDVKNKSFTLTATVDIPEAGAEGVLATEGGRFGGWGLVMYKSAPTFIYKFFNFPGQMVRLDSKKPLAPGKHTIVVDFKYDGGGIGKGGPMANSWRRAGSSTRFPAGSRRRASASARILAPPSLTTIRCPSPSPARWRRSTCTSPHPQGCRRRIMIEPSGRHAATPTRENTS
jgi:hypothetical protein